jgi:hypothetical protein
MKFKCMLSFLAICLLFGQQMCDNELTSNEDDIELSEKICENEIRLNRAIGRFCRDMPMVICSSYLNKFLHNIKFMFEREKKCQRFLEIQRQMKRIGDMFKLKGVDDKVKKYL